MELSAYRIVQEALSNAMRHAPGSDVRVEVAYLPASLELRVVNGPPRARPVRSDGPGHGVLGMRERAAMLYLVLAEETIKTRVSRILFKLGLRDRTQAAVFAYETGLIRPYD